MKLKKYSEFISEGKKHNYADYLESLPFWKDFIQKFNMLRNKKRKGGSPDTYKYYKDKSDSFYDRKPSVKFIDEWELERIHYDWTSGYAEPKIYGSETSNKIKFEGLKDPEIGDILISFRGYAWLFKPNKDFKFTCTSSAAWKHDTPNKWDDIIYFNNFVTEFTFQLTKEEIPIIFRNKLSRQIRRTSFDKETGYKQRTKIPSSENGKITGYSLK